MGKVTLFRTWEEQDEEEASRDGGGEESPDGLESSDPVNGVEAPELEVGEEVAHQHRALQHRVEEAAVARHSALLRVVGQESTLQIIILSEYQVIGLPRP